jgi:hypothetical protein
MDDTAHHEIRSQSDEPVFVGATNNLTVKRARSTKTLKGEAPVTHWPAGAVLIALGILFMAHNMGALNLINTWALFILFPAAGALGAGWKVRQMAGGRLTTPARVALFGGFMLVCLAGVFLFDLSWVSIGPVLIILAGIGLIIHFILI